VVCGECGIGSDGEHFGSNDAELGRMSEFNHEASGGKCVPRAVSFNLEPGVIGAVTLSRRSESSSSRKPS
jgi:hypothetical protein